MERWNVDGLKLAIHQYFNLIDDMSDEFLVMYQEVEIIAKRCIAICIEKRNVDGRFI